VAVTKEWLEAPDTADAGRRPWCMFPSIVHTSSGHYWASGSALRMADVGFKAIVTRVPRLWALNVARKNGELQGLYARFIVHHVFENGLYPVVAKEAHCEPYRDWYSRKREVKPYPTGVADKEYAEWVEEVAHPLLLATPPLISEAELHQMALLFADPRGRDGVPWNTLAGRSLPVQCPFVAFASSAELAMRAAGVATGVIVMVGFSTAWVVPIVRGKQDVRGIDSWTIKPPLPPDGLDGGAAAGDDDVHNPMIVDGLPVDSPMARMATFVRDSSTFDWTNAQETWTAQAVRATRPEPVPWEAIAKAVVSAAHAASRPRDAADDVAARGRDAAGGAGGADAEAPAASLQAELLSRVVLSGGGTIGEAPEAAFKSALARLAPTATVIVPADRIYDVVKGGCDLARSPAGRDLFHPTCDIVSRTWAKGADDVGPGD